MKVSILRANFTIQANCPMQTSTTSVANSLQKHRIEVSTPLKWSSQLFQKPTTIKQAVWKITFLDELSKNLWNKRTVLMKSFLLKNLFCSCSMHSRLMYVMASYLGSNRIFKIFNTKWSYDTMLVDWVWSGQTLGLYMYILTSSQIFSPPAFPFSQ